MAIRGVFALSATRPHVHRVCKDALGLMDWGKSFGEAPATEMPLSPSAATSQRVIMFKDRFMAEGRNILSGYDASEGALYVLLLAVLTAHPSSPRLYAMDNADHGLNPRLARALVKCYCRWLLDAPKPQQQVLLTTPNPLVLDALPLQDDRVRLFTVPRTATGRTFVQRIQVNEQLMAKARESLTLSQLWVMGHLAGVADV